MNIDAENRAVELLRILQNDGFIKTKDAADALGVSPLTIRRDLVELQQQRLVRIVRGGAKPVAAPPFSTRNIQFDAEKTAVAGKLLPLVPTTGTIAIDSSTTLARLCRRLTGVHDLTVVTNSLINFNTLQGRPGITPLITGGFHHEESDSLTGEACIRFIEGFHFDFFFASTAAYLPSRGGFESTPVEAAVKRAFVRASAQVILGLNTEKLTERAPYASFENTDIDTLCTDLTPADVRSAYPTLPTHIDLL